MTYSTLVSAGTLAQHVNDPHWVVFDCRHDLAKPDWGKQEYVKAHIPGARLMHLDRDLSGPLSGKNGRHPLPDPEAFVRKLGEAGVDASKQVVAYDAQGGMFAARLWWMLRFWLGHEAAAVLDGGWVQWLAQGHSQSSGLSPHAPVCFAGRARPAVDAAYVLAQLHRPGMTLVDARAPDRYRGENETLDPVAGHIPGALNRPFRDNLGADGNFKPADQLRFEFHALLGDVRPGEVVHQCGSGVTACHNLLAMEIAGFPGSRLYPGSWSEWCADPARPVTTGPTP